MGNRNPTLLITQEYPRLSRDILNHDGPPAHASPWTTRPRRRASHPALVRQITAVARDRPRRPRRGGQLSGGRLVSFAETVSG